MCCLVIIKATGKVKKGCDKEKGVKNTNSIDAHCYRHHRY